MQRRWTLTEDDLRRVPDDELVQKVIDSVLNFIGDLGPGEDDYELVRQIPKSAQFFWAMRLLESEVNNGGYEQYFWNSSCTLTGVALEAYKAIGALKYIEFLQEAMALAGDESWAARRRMFNNDWKTYKEACQPALDALDAQFYAAHGGDSDSGGGDEVLHQLKVRYIRQNLLKICAF